MKYSMYDYFVCYKLKAESFYNIANCIHLDSLDDIKEPVPGIDQKQISVFKLIPPSIKEAEMIRLVSQ